MGSQNLFHSQARDALWPGRTGCKAPDEGHMSIWSRRATQQPTVLAATRRDGAESNGPMPLLSALGQVDEAQAASACSGAHLFVGSPRNIDILLRTLLLELHPTLPPSHTCLVIKQVLDLLECAKHVEHSV